MNIDSDDILDLVSSDDDESYFEANFEVNLGDSCWVECWDDYPWVVFQDDGIAHSAAYSDCNRPWEVSQGVDGDPVERHFVDKPVMQLM